MLVVARDPGSGAMNRGTLSKAKRWIVGASAVALFSLPLFPRNARADALDRAVLAAQVEFDSAQQQQQQHKKQRDDAAKSFNEQWDNLLKKLFEGEVKDPNELVGGANSTLSDGQKALCGEAGAGVDEHLKKCKEKIERTRKELNGLKEARDVKGLKSWLEKAKSENVGTAAVDLSAFYICGLPPATDRAAWHAACKQRIDGSEDEVKRLESKRAEYSQANERFENASRLVEARKESLNALLERKLSVVTKPNRSLPDRLRGAREVRCYTAYCWGGDGTKYGIEPILDLPVGISWAIGNGALANYINANRVDVAVSAGLRVWFAYDVVSVGVLIARPSLNNQASIELEYSDVKFPRAAVNRPFPTLVLGLWGDVFAITASYDQLRNTDGSEAVDPNYLPNEVLSRAVVLGLSINPFTAVRNAVGHSRAGAGSDE